jgi:hypothetical protein
VVSNLDRPKRQKTGGRQKNTPNKVTTSLKEAILEAAKRAGNGDIATYLQAQANSNPGPFMALLGKVLPMQVTGANDGPLQVVIQRYADDQASS